MLGISALYKLGKTAAPFHLLTCLIGCDVTILVCLLSIMGTTSRKLCMLV